MLIEIPDKPKRVINALMASGFEAYAVGGCVRNALMGLTPHDWDICTSAKPEEMLQVFKEYETLDFGLKHGTLAVMVEGELFEVTTYRVDGVYSDNRHPESVTFTDNLTLDLSRRDFTCNAMAYNGTDGIIDPFGGAEDLKNNLLRCVGDPDRRFHEDALRILRALRFASAYGFKIEEATSKSVHSCAELLNNVAAERIRDELIGILIGKNALAILSDYRDVFAVFVPELIETFDFPQRSPHHRHDVWQHIVHTVAAIDSDPLLRIVMLLHDIGKPRARTTDLNGTDHFKGHQQISAWISESILRRLRFPNSFIDNCLLLILSHDIRFDGSQKQVRRTLQKLGEDNMRRLFKIQRADIAAQSEYLRAEKLAGVDRAEEAFERILSEDQCYQLKDLAVNGKDIIGMDLFKGREIGETLNALLDEVIDGTLKNEKNALLKRARQYYKEKRSR